jgi:hypothetical protein
MANCAVCSTFVSLLSRACSLWRIVTQAPAGRPEFMLDPPEPSPSSAQEGICQGRMCRTPEDLAAPAISWPVARARQNQDGRGGQSRLKPGALTRISLCASTGRSDASRFARLRKSLPRAWTKRS